MQTYPTGYAESHRMAEQIFREILPRHGMAVREEQIALCHEVLDTLYNKEISLCEAGVGIGKTLAYLVACILWQMHRPHQLKMPVVISTSSVALQDAILNEYLPDLSVVLLAEGIITAPITAVVRKGKERFVCDARLAERQAKAITKGQRQKSSLRIAENVLDLDHIPGLSRYDRCRICVPQSCPRDCFLRLDCRYQQYLRDSMKPDIQICNHNYLLANASHRLEERPLLLRQYQALVVDEAHKLPDAARQMYTETLSAQDMNSEMILTVLSAFAQAESESISQNVARGKRMGYKHGKFAFPYGRIIGYKKGADGKPEIIPEQAEIIRLIFNSYLQGDSLQSIKAKLETAGALTARGNTAWSAQSMHPKILTRKSESVLIHAAIRNCVAERRKSVCLWAFPVQNSVRSRHKQHGCFPEKSV